MTQPKLCPDTLDDDKELTKDLAKATVEVFGGQKIITFPATSQNLAVSEKSSGVSKYRGVSPYRGKWRASVSRDGVYKTKAGFETEEEAHQEYLKLRKSLYVELYTS